MVGDPERFNTHDGLDGRECPTSLMFASAYQAWLANTEDRFTAPTDRCPHPERWHSTDQDSAEIEVSNLVGAFVAALAPTVVVETGSAWGQTAEAMAATPGAVDWLTVHTIEPDSTRAAYTRQRCEHLPVVVHEMASLDWEPVEGIGFAWFDSLLDLRVKEFRHLYPHFAKGAVVGFHDTSPWFGPQLTRDILGLEHEGLLLPMFLPTPRGVCFAEVV